MNDQLWPVAVDDWQRQPQPDVAPPELMGRVVEHGEQGDEDELEHDFRHLRLGIELGGVVC